MYYWYSCVSDFTHRYLCDFSFYTSLSIDRSRSAFIHVPPLGQPYSEDQLGDGLAIAVSAMLKQLTDQKSSWSTVASESTLYSVLPKTLKQLCIIIFICNILFPNYIYFKFVICNSRLKLISLTKIENQIEKELCHTVAKPNFCCANSVQCIWIAYPREFFILRNIVKKEGNFPFKSYGAFSMIFNDILKSFSVCH